MLPLPERDLRFARYVRILCDHCEFSRARNYRANARLDSGIAIDISALLGIQLQ